MSQVHIDDVLVGDTLVLDDGFTCHDAGPVIIKVDPDREGTEALYFDCRDGRHYIEGQVDNPDGVLVGMTRPVV